MVYKQNIPQPADNLDDSQVDLLGNFQQLDVSFGIDHYKFSDLTSTNGFHNTVTTPAFVDNPATGLPPVTVAIPKMFGFQFTVNTGILQFSKGPTTVPAEPTPPTPLTSLQGKGAGYSINPGASINIFDFTGMPGVISKAYAFDTGANSAEYLVCWNGGALTAVTRIGGSSVSLQFIAAGAVLTLKNASGGILAPVVWTLDFKRIS